MSLSESDTQAAARVAARAFSNPVRATGRLLALLTVTVVLLVGWLVVKAASREKRRRYARAVRWSHCWTRWCCRFAGIRLSSSGPLPAPGSVVAPNHLGYADVLAIGGAVPCFFVAKVDVESWPFIGLLFRVSESVGVPRSRTKALVQATQAIAERLRCGQSVCVFFEGTSTGGDRLLPFYPPLAQPAVEAGAPVVPVALRWSCDMPGADVAEDIAYWKDHTFGPHAWRLLGLKGVRCDITFGNPIPPIGHTRKTLAAAAEAAVAALCGFPPDANR